VLDKDEYSAFESTLNSPQSEITEWTDLTTPLYVLTVVNSAIFNNKKHLKQVAVCKNVKCWQILSNSKTRRISA